MIAVEIPSEVLLSCIGYRVQVHEGCVVFSAKKGVYGCYTRMTFTRKCGCWYVAISDSGDDCVMVSHIQQAAELVCEWFGGNFDFANGENEL